MGKDVVITYETLFDMLRNEKSKEELQPLSGTFISDLQNYLRDKQTLQTQKQGGEFYANIEREKVQKQVDNIRKLVRELYERREKKITNMALIYSRTGSILDMSTLLDDERKMFEALTKVLDEYRCSVLLKLLNIDVSREKHALPRHEMCEKPVQVKKNLRFLTAVPKFLGKELEIYGPYEQDVTAEIPAELAEILISKGKAEEIKG